MGRLIREAPLAHVAIAVLAGASVALAVVGACMALYAAARLWG